MPGMNVSMTPELMKIVQAKVDSGLYNNASEVIRDAVRQMDATKNLIYEIKLANLKQALAEGLQQVKNGEVREVSYESMIKKLDSKKHE